MTIRTKYKNGLASTSNASWNDIHSRGTWNHLLIFFVFLLVISCAPMLRPDDQQSHLKGFKLLPLGSDAEPGTILAEYSDGTISTPLVTRERLLKFARDKTLLNSGPAKQHPKKEIDRKKEFLAMIQAQVQLSKFESGTELGMALGKVNSITEKVEDGISYGLAAGQIAYQDLLEDLPVDDLERIFGVINNGGKPVMVSEVQVYKKASLDFTWTDDINANIQSKIANVLAVGAVFKWSDSQHLSVEYSEPTLVGYRSFDLNVQALKDEIQKKKSDAFSGRIPPVSGGDSRGRKPDLLGILIQKCNMIDPASIKRRPEIFLPQWISTLKRMRLERTTYDLLNLVEVWGRALVGVPGEELIREANFTLTCLESEKYLKVDDTKLNAQYWGVNL